MESSGDSMRKTKIVCTIGPSSDTPGRIRDLINSGMDCARLNTSHGSVEYHRTVMNRIRRITRKIKQGFSVILDLSGPKIRVGNLREPLALHRGETVALVREGRESDHDEGKAIPVISSGFFVHLKKGDTVYLSDGSIRLRVLTSGRNLVYAEVIEGGVLTSHKGVNIPGISGEYMLTRADKHFIEFGIVNQVDWIALSFITSERDVMQAKKAIQSKGADIPVIAKIERAEAVENIKKIIRVSDGIMIARGDLGVELPVEEIPIIQKRIIELCNSSGKPVITATQMLSSMVLQPNPTRAEVTDVANAVLDGSDAVMLSEETAVGKYPVKAVRIMSRIIERAETLYPYLRKYETATVNESIAHSTAEISMEIGAEAIVTFTRTGMSAINVSRFRPGVPIIAIAHDEKVLRKLSIVWGCVPLGVVPENSDPESAIGDVLKISAEKGITGKKGYIVLTSGFPFGEPGSTNTIRVIKIENIMGS